MRRERADRREWPRTASRQIHRFSLHSGAPKRLLMDEGNGWGPDRRSGQGLAVRGPGSEGRAPGHRDRAARPQRLFLAGIRGVEGRKVPSRPRPEKGRLRPSGQEHRRVRVAARGRGGTGRSAAGGGGRETGRKPGGFRQWDSVDRRGVRRTLKPSFRKEDP
jgi:hypothetical protein